MDKQIEKVLTSFNIAYGQNVAEKDIYVFKQAVYLGTSKVAEFLRIERPHFSAYYSKEIKDKVHVIHQGKFKWYKLHDLRTLMDKSVANNETIKVMCSMSSAKYRKLKSVVLN